MRVLRNTALAAAGAALAGAIAVAQPAAAAGPTCPNHPNVPAGGHYLSTRQTASGPVDVYRVPNRFGFTLVTVNCG